MKTHITRNDLKALQLPVYCVPYCELHALLSLLPYDSCIGYNAGYFGHNYDVWQLDGAIITTGYRPIGKKLPGVMIRSFEHMAQDIQRRYASVMDPGYIREAAALLHSFSDALTLY